MGRGFFHWAPWKAEEASSCRLRKLWEGKVTKVVSCLLMRARPPSLANPPRRFSLDPSGPDQVLITIMHKLVHLLLYSTSTLNCLLSSPAPEIDLSYESMTVIGLLKCVLNHYLHVTTQNDPATSP